MNPTTTPHEVWGGRVTFQTRHYSLKHKAELEAVRSQFEKVGGDTYLADQRLFDTFAYYLVTTVDVEFAFIGGEAGWLQDFCAFWGEYKKLREKGRREDAAKLAFEFRLETSGEVVTEWLHAVNAAEMPFRNPVQLPGTDLTEEEAKEVGNPDSPLPKAGKPSGSSSATG